MLAFKRKDRKEEKVRVALGTKDEAVIATVRGMGMEVVGEAFTTAGLYRLLPQADLIIADLQALLEVDLTREGLERAIAAAGTPVAGPASFLAGPESWRTQGLLARGVVEALPPRTLAFASYSGGVGKTVLSLDTAVAFARLCRLPVAVVEFCYGPSAFGIFTGCDGAGLYEVAMQGAAPQQWRGISLVPMTYATARLVPQERIAATVRSLAGKHILTILDLPYPHPLFPQGVVEDWLVLADARRPDTLAAAQALAEELRLDDRRAHTVVNRRGVLPPPIRAELSLPEERGAERLEGRLGERVLRYLYPGLGRRSAKSGTFKR